jgi:hypothetical protein
VGCKLRDLPSFRQKRNGEDGKNGVLRSSLLFRTRPFPVQQVGKEAYLLVSWAPLVGKEKGHGKARHRILLSIGNGMPEDIEL